LLKREYRKKQESGATCFFQFILIFHGIVAIVFLRNIRYNYNRFFKIIDL